MMILHMLSSTMKLLLTTVVLLESSIIVILIPRSVDLPVDQITYMVLIDSSDN